MTRKDSRGAKSKAVRMERSICQNPPPSTQKQLKLRSPSAGVLQGRAASLLNAASFILSWIYPASAISASVWGAVERLGLHISLSSSAHKDEKT